MPLYDNVTTLTFDLVSKPPPETLSFVYLGAEVNATSARPLVSPDAFSVLCTPSSNVTSRYACVITVVSVTEVEEGVHGLDIGNSMGTTRYLFRVAFNGKPGYYDTLGLIFHRSTLV